jgi:YD repeat-containing protein
MSASVSRRDLFRGLLAAGLAWLGLGKLARAAPAVPAAPVVPPFGELPSRLTTIQDYGDVGTVTTFTFDGHSRVLTVRDSRGGVRSLVYPPNGCELWPASPKEERAQPPEAPPPNPPSQV